jgi:hypothetical protein
LRHEPSYYVVLLGRLYGDLVVPYAEGETCANNFPITIDLRVQCRANWFGVITDNLEVRHLMPRRRPRNGVAFPLSGNKSEVGEV